MIFNPCNGKCTHEGTHCDGCGRSHDDIAKLNALLAGVVGYAADKKYENIEDFATAVGRSVLYKLQNPA